MQLVLNLFQLLSVHALSGSALNTSLSGNLPDLADVIGEIGISLFDLMHGNKPPLLLPYMATG